MIVSWSALADRRALEAVAYIAQDRPLAAGVWLEELLARVAGLDRFARRGRIVPAIARPAYREIWQAPYRVIYRLDGVRVVILTLRHWRRAWDPDEVPADA